MSASDISVTSAELKHVKSLLKDPEKIGLVGMLSRIGVPSLSVFIEWRFFSPKGGRNHLLDIFYIAWQNLMWVVIIFPRRDLPAISTLLVQLGLTRAEGSPVIVGGGIERFPIGGQNLYTLEYPPGGRPAYPDKEAEKAAIKAEYLKHGLPQEMVDTVGNARVMTEDHKLILNVWNHVENDEPGISTEQLLARVASICKCDVDKVTEALFIQTKKTHE